MAKISKTQLNSRLENLENKITGLQTLESDEIEKLNNTIEHLNLTGEFMNNKYGEFLLRFESLY